MPRLSILIPALGTPEGLETTLLSVLENRPHDCQVLVALGIEYSNPYQLDDEVEFLPDAGRSWVQCVNAGLARCRAGVVHVLGAGTQIEDQWTRHALGHFEADEIGLVAPLVLNAQDPTRVVLSGIRYGWGGSRVVASRMLEKQRDVAPSSIAGYYRLDMVTRLGGFSTAVGDELADLDLALRAKAAGWRMACEPRSRVYSPPLPPTVRGLRSGLYAERFFWRHARHHHRILALAGHGTRIAGEMAAGLWKPSNVLHCIGRLGAIWPAHDLRHEFPGIVMPQEAGADLLGLPTTPKTDSATRRRVA